MSLKSKLNTFAREAGFSAMGVCRPDAAPETAGRLAAFVEAGMHGQMGWLAERMHWRGSAAALWPEARSVIMLTEAYTPRHDPLDVLKEPKVGAISVYAQGRDYHDIVKKRLKRVGRWLLEQAPGEQIKVFVDTAPVMEKPLAQAAGLGWQGKHTNLVGKGAGNWVFLGAIFTTIDLEPDPPETDHCGSCRACLDICPTEAFSAPYQLDARRCISYLTIEHKGPIEPELRSRLGNRIYGCDDCLAVCPWNKFAAQATEMRYFGNRDPLPLSELAELDDPTFRQLFSGSPVKRIGRDKFVRNVLYAIGNSSDATLLEAARGKLHDADATVVDAARWAVERLGG